MIPTEQCYGVIVVSKDKEYLFLILEQHNVEAKFSWSFPKGHHEGLETPRDTALRELKEETGITEIKLLDVPLIHEEYKVIHQGQKEEYLKLNDYFIGVVENAELLIQENEIRSYKWATYDEALEAFTYSVRKETLQKAKEYLDTLG